jgi:hypothetical protein
MPALIVMHNIDVMHQECKMVESIISTCMGFLGKTEDNMKARQDLTDLCNRPSIELKVNGASHTLHSVLNLNRGKKLCDG